MVKRYRQSKPGFIGFVFVKNDPEVNIDHLLSSYINICVSVLSPTTPAEITTASARSIVSATLLLRSQTIAESPQMAKLFTEFKGLKDNHLLVRTHDSF